MPLFPDISPSYGYKITPQFRTLVLGDSDDLKQRRKKRLNPLFEITLLYDDLEIDESDIITLYDFFMARSCKY